MLDRNNLNRIRGILSARQGAEIPKFQGGAKFAMYNGSQVIYSADQSNWFTDEALSLKYPGSLGGFKSIQYTPTTKKQPLKPASHVPLAIPGEPEVTPTSAVETAAANAASAQQKEGQLSEAEYLRGERYQPIQLGENPLAKLNSPPVLDTGLASAELAASAEKSAGMKVEAQAKKEAGYNAAGQVATAAFQGIGAVIGAQQKATDSDTTKMVDTAYNAAAEGIKQAGPVGQVIGTAMQMGQVAGDIIQSLGGGTDQQTTVDKWMDSALFSWNIGMLNGFAGKNTQDFGVDQSIMSQVGSSYGDSVNAISEAANKAGKKYGLFSTKARKKADAAINLARSQQNAMGNVADTAATQRLAVQSMGEQAGLAYSMMTNGGYDQKYTYAAKQGGALEWNPVIALEWEPQIELNWELPSFKEGGNIDINEELEWIPEFKSGGKSKLSKKVLDFYKNYDLSGVNIEMSDSPRTEGNTIYISSDEDAIHELWHYLSNNQPNEVYKDYYDNLNDDRIIELGGNLQFVKRFENDPGHFYHPSELEARIKAAKFQTRGKTYDKEFFQNLRKNENKYGNNMRDLLYMFSDDNLVKLFNLESGEKARSIEELIEYAKKQNPRFIQRLSEEPRSIKFTDNEGNEAEGSHYLESRGEYVIPRIQEIDGELKFLNPQEAFDRAIEVGNYLEMTPEEAILFAEKYKQGWPDFFKTFKSGGSVGNSDVPETEETAQKNVIPEGALHKNKHHMEHAEGLTKKGIPVIDDDGDQQAEIEHSEIIFTLEVTKKLEEYYEIFYSDESSNKEKEQAALDAGKLLVYQILENTEDRTGLIDSCKQGGTLTFKKSTEDLIEDALEWMPTIVVIEEEPTKPSKKKEEKSDKEAIKEVIKEVLIELLIK